MQSSIGRRNAEDFNGDDGEDDDLLSTLTFGASSAKLFVYSNSQQFANQLRDSPLKIGQTINQKVKD